MKKYHHLLPSTLIFIILLLTISIAVTMAQKPQDSQEILKSVALQKNDFPTDTPNYTFFADQITIEDFNGVTSFVTYPFQVQGFINAYRVSGWYPFTLHNTDLAQNVSNGAFVDNITYLFQNSTQATQAFEEQLEQFYTNQQDAANNKNISNTTIPKSTHTETVEYGNLHGQLIKINYVENNINFNVTYLISAVDNHLLFLMVDGIADPATQEVFERLANKLVNY